jgi:hypothetical protein
MVKAMAKMVMMILRNIDPSFLEVILVLCADKMQVSAKLNTN